MSKTSDAVINTGTDPAALSAVGSAFLKFHAGGWGGAAFYIAATAVCAALRVNAERHKGSPATKPAGRFQEMLLNPRLPIAVMGVVQFGVAAEIAWHGGGLNAHTLQEMAVPLLFGTGNMIAAKSVVQTLFRSAAKVATTARKAASGARKLAGQIFGKPDAWWTVGMIGAGGSLASTVVFSAGLAVKTAQSLWHSRPHDDASAKSPLGRFMNAEYMPALLNAAGCLTSCIVLAHGGHPLEAEAMGIYTASYLGYAADTQFGGTAGVLHALRPSHGDQPRSGPMAHA